MRRPSFLDTIPEVDSYSIEKSLVLSHDSLYQHNEAWKTSLKLEQRVGPEDVEFTAATSWDPKFPPSTVFRHGGNKVGESRIWITTGLCPQILTFSLICSRRLYRVEVDCVSFHSLYIRNESTSKSSSTQRMQVINANKRYVTLQIKWYFLNW